LFALTALAALTAYILACGTAFSPDDSKVLYTTINPRTGATGIAVYDRTSGQSQTIFTPTFQDLDFGKTAPAIIRPQWLPSGKDIVVAWPGGNASTKDNELSLAVLPFGRADAVKLFFLSEVRDSEQLLRRPLPIAGHFLFLASEAESNTTSIVRLDLLTGELRTQTNLPALRLLPTPHGDAVIYLAEMPGGDQRGELGLLNPDTFARTAVFQTVAGAPTPDFDDNKGFVAISRDGQRLAFTDTEEGKPVCRVLQNGKLFKTLPLLGENSELVFGNAQFSPSGAMLYASFMDAGAGGTNGSGGVIEIPLDGGALRRNTLISGLGEVDNDFALYFQLDLAKDGKTLAIASTYLAYEEGHKLKPANCALFLLNLADPQRAVTRVPVPLPPAELLSQ